jgi:hypothetical protein
MCLADPFLTVEPLIKLGTGPRHNVAAATRNSIISLRMTCGHDDEARQHDRNHRYDSLHPGPLSQHQYTSTSSRPLGELASPHRPCSALSMHQPDNVVRIANKKAPQVRTCGASLFV